MRVLWCVLAACVAAVGQTAVHVARATQLMQDRLFAAAGSEFEIALKQEPSNNGVRFQYAACLFAQGRNEEARQQFEAVRRQTGDSPGVNYYLGRLDLLGGDFASAVGKLRAAEADPAFSRAAFYLGLAYLGTGNRAEAIHSLERAATASPRDGQVHYRLARAYSAAGRSDDADREYKLYNDCRNTLRTTEQDVRECAKALRSSRIEEARPVCQRVADPNDPERLVVLAQLYGERGAYDDAIEPLRRAVQIDAESFEAWHDLGLTLFRLKRYGDARAPLERAVALNPEFADTLNLLAATLYVLGDDAAALPVLEKLHSLKPGDAQVSAALERVRAAVREKR
ncbi:MAG TPA: tetratricopeptide repeat protein [Bryobacteraceae bacterium]|nr:tetratricopeptide repeat protein [Bryobacteraceae bacterium]